METLLAQTHSLADALSSIAAANSMTLDFQRLYRGYSWAAEMRWIGGADVAPGPIAMPDRRF